MFTRKQDGYHYIDNQIRFLAKKYKRGRSDNWPLTHNFLIKIMVDLQSNASTLFIISTDISSDESSRLIMQAVNKISNTRKWQI